MPEENNFAVLSVLLVHLDNGLINSLIEKLEGLARLEFA
jgi:hypothetical protein